METKALKIGTLKILSIFLTGIATISVSAEEIFGKELIFASEFLAIRAALPEMERNNIKDIEGYGFFVVERENEISVTIGDPNSPESCRGQCGPKVSFTVRLSKKDLRVLGSNFNR
ncbi:hypothetical protein [Microvirga flavescens]|uniref:hypothetical protein n=1 Tax=Microvirga flavescens TaxID=2249811 RepID=UPI0013009EBB|nr:hypothetical protein [Microvirga flavescens]